MRLSRRHPRYRSLVVRARLAAAHRDGVVVGEGLIAHGRAEAFDYLLGERTTPSARRAERAAADWLRAARSPVVSVNGNVAALAAPEIAALARAIPHLAVEVNLFHRTPGRAERIARILTRAGVRDVLGVRPTARIPGLPSDRALVDRRGIYRADVCLVPLEDGDRAEALRARGTRVIAIDLNPLSRTSLAADVPIVDELTRALHAIARSARARPAQGPRTRGPRFDAARARADALATIARRLSRSAGRRRSPRRRG
ncbi:MAG TPA: phosphopantothenate/pantothenate synthetase [Thermoplasmata archaeon]|nr:phosphopantothenate/pantothenate synthetase [Thermoplasmata archaeon]